MPLPRQFEWLCSRAAAPGVMALGLLLSLTACKKAADDAAGNATSAGTPVRVQAAHPTVGAISDEIEADAILAPLAQAALAPRISAPIQRQYVQRGAHVRAGQLLVTLEDRELQGAARDSQGSLLQAQAAFRTATHATIPEELQKAQLDVEQARVTLELANRTADERKRLLAEGAIAGRDTDTAIAAAVQAQATYDLATQHLAAARETIRVADAQAAQGALTSAEGRYASAEAQVGYAALRSPIAGVVTDRPFFAGETAPAGTAVVTVMDTSSLLAKLHVAQATAQQLRLGAEAEVMLPGVSEPVAATVSLISPALDPGSTTVEVWLRLRNEDGALKVGTPVHVRVRGRTVAHALQVPAAAILPTSDGDTAVLVVGADGVAHRRVVSLGLRTPGAAEIVKGLAVNDTVVVGGGYGLDDGTRVTVSADRPAAEDKD